MLKTMIMMLGLTVGVLLASTLTQVTGLDRHEQVTYLVPTDPGGGYDAYARMIGRYMERHLGAQNVIIKNVPGAGHIIGANMLWHSKPDGLTIGTLNSGLIYGQLIGRKVQQFDLAEFAWIGKAASEPRVIVVSRQCDVNGVADLRSGKVPVKFATGAIGSSGFADMRLLAEALDLNVELIMGYGGTEGEMAMMRGEVCATLGSRSSLQGFVDSGYASFILSVGGKVDGIPHAMEFARTDRAKQIVSLIDSVAQLGRLTVAPPGTPPDRLEALRAAYRAALEDPALLAEAERTGRPIDPAYGEEVREQVVRVLDQSPEMIEMVAEALSFAPPSNRSGSTTWISREFSTR